MIESSPDTGVITVLLQRLETQRLPRILALKDKVDSGALLGDTDIAFLGEALADANRIKPILDRNPQYQGLAARVSAVYKEIADRALENEKAS